MYKTRNTCRLCPSKDISKIIAFKDVPLGEKYTDTPNRSGEKRFPIDLYYCASCCAVQTITDIDSKLLWSGYTYLSGQTPGIVKHLESVSDSICEDYQFDSSSKCLDIGSNDGTLLKGFKSKGFQVFGVDPAKSVAEVANINGIETHVGFFNSNEISNYPDEFQSVDIVTAFNVFAHSDDMPGLLEGVKMILSDEGIFCFEVQYLGDIIDKKILGTIFHEHMIHYSASALQIFLASQEMKIVQIRRTKTQMGSIVVCAAHEGSKYKADENVSEFLQEEERNGVAGKAWCDSFTDFVESSNKKAQQLITKYKEKQYAIAGYGAARSGPMLAIQLGFDGALQFLLDDHELKCNKYSSYRNLYVKPAQNILNEKVDVAVILAWIHARKIIRNNCDYIHQGGRFVTVWPSVEEINRDNYLSYIES